MGKSEKSRYTCPGHETTINKITICNTFLLYESYKNVQLYNTGKKYNMYFHNLETNYLNYVFSFRGIKIVAF